MTFNDLKSPVKICENSPNLLLLFLLFSCDENNKSLNMFLLMASRPSGAELNYISDYDMTIITINNLYLSSSPLTPAAVPGSPRIPLASPKLPGYAF